MMEEYGMWKVPVTSYSLLKATIDFCLIIVMRQSIVLLVVRQLSYSYVV